ncbi:MAG: glycosyltransferase family 2 protein, partial [Chitinophagaceae bacterium]
MKSGRTLFTIVTVTYNSSKWVKNAIESVLASDYASFEYIIADDCSSDETWEIISTYSDSRIRKFRHEQNRGEYANRNFALHKATGDYLLFVDGDDELYKDALSKLATYVGQFPDAGSIWGVPSN